MAAGDETLAVMALTGVLAMLFAGHPVFDDCLLFDP